MNLSWKDYLGLHAPYIVMGMIAIISAIYAAGYENGKRSILHAASVASIEVK